MKLFQKLNPVFNEINQAFGFLLGKGFKIRSSNFIGHQMLSWEIIFESDICLIRIFKERNDIFLSLAPINSIDEKNEIDIDSEIGIKQMLYYISDKKNFIGLDDDDTYNNRKKQLNALAKLLGENLDKIKPYFENEKFLKYKSEIIQAQKDYNDLLTEKYVLNIQMKEKI